MHVAREAHGFQTTDKAVQDIIGLSLMNGIDILYPLASEAQKLAIQQSYAEYYIANSHSTPLFEPNRSYVADATHTRQTACGSHRKKKKGTESCVDASKSHHYFVMTRCADEAGSKPDPQMLHDILEHTQQKISDAVFIGDSIYDIQMATQLGMTSIAVDYGTASSADFSGAAANLPG